MPNKNKKKNNHYQFNKNGSGGVGKGNFKTKGQRLHINPNAIITSVSDDEAMPRANPNGNRYSSLSNEGKKNKKNRGRNFINGLKDVAKCRPGKMGIGDDDEEVPKKPLLPSKPHCRIASMGEDVFGVIVNFVQNYFNCFDANREGLLGAYNKQCIFSLTLNMSNTVAYRQFKFPDFYIKGNRNLKRIMGQDSSHVEKRYRLQTKGYIETLAQLCKMPPTEHEPRSFKLDVDYFTPQMIKFSVSGTLKEGKPTDKVRPLRSFHKVLVCIPDTTSPMTVVNEQLTISHLTHAQHKEYYYVQTNSNKMTDSPPKSNAAVQPMNPQIVPNNQPALTTPLLPQFPDLTDQQKLMIQEFSKQSTLNFEWSKYCLEHVNWNYDAAAKAFMESKDSIPKEAFLV